MNHILPRPASRRPIILAALGAALLLGMVVIFAGVARANTPAASVSVEGIIAADTTWASSLTVTGPVTVTAAATLNIQPGVEVRFLPGTWMRIEGGLNAQGTQAKQIRMIPDSDLGAPWLGVVVAQPSRDVRLQSVTISRAVVGLAINPAGALQPLAGPTRVDIRDSLFDSNTTGILANFAGATNNMTVTLRNNLITNNGTGAQMLNIANNSKIKLNHNSFVGNGIGLKATGQGQIRARQQWWGSANGPRVGDPLTCLAAPGAGDIVCGPVAYSPWSKRPTGRMILAAGEGAILESALGQSAASDDDTLPSSTGTLTVPVGTFSQSVDLLISDRTPAELPGAVPGQPTEIGLEITAANNGQEIHTFAPGHTLSLTIDYTDADLAGADPAK
ncbi:MAG TPA: NosD domain-containing protein, partial [Roseiflexaceae bacterium]|nr:NosD domain-containing protein [Roseiflexaceae bacterium]